MDRETGERGHGDSGVTIVVSPLIALMKDQVDALRRRGVAAECIDSTKSWQQVQEMTADLHSGKLRLLYCAPERLNNEGFVESIKYVRGGVRLIAVDEAHCISEVRRLSPLPVSEDKITHVCLTSGDTLSGLTISKVYVDVFTSPLDVARADEE